MTSARGFNAACGHFVLAGTRVCPACGYPLPAIPEPRPARPWQAAPPQWPWQVSDDDDLHAVQSDPTALHPSFYAQTSVYRDPRASGPRRLLLPMIAVAVAAIVITAVAVVLLSRHPGNASATNDSVTVKATQSATADRG
jgi:hypothetical protein